MLCSLRLVGSLFFILSVFIYTDLAQTSEKHILPGNTEEKSVDIIITGYSEKSAEAESKNPFEIKPDFDRHQAQPRPDQQDAPAAAEDYKLARGDKEFVLEYGVSPFNPSNFAGPKEFDVYNRDLHQANFRIGRIIGTKKNVSYEYLFGASPLIVFTGNEVKNPAYISASETPNVAPTIRETTYGVGIQPVNFRFIFFAKSRWKPYAQVGAGILFTGKAVPVPRSKPLNFTGDFGGGLQYMISKKHALTFGYRYFHISNGNIGGKINNPGYNANVFFVGYGAFFK